MSEKRREERAHHYLARTVVSSIWLLADTSVQEETPSIAVHHANMSMWIDNSKHMSASRPREKAVSLPNTLGTSCQSMVTSWDGNDDDSK